MPTTVRNEKGLFASPTSGRVDKAMFETLKEEAAAAGRPEAVAWLAQFEAIARARAAGGVDERYSVIVVKDLVGSFSNETALWGAEPDELRAWWEGLAAHQALKAGAFDGWAPSEGTKARRALDSIDASLPKKSASSKAKSLSVEALEEGWEAKGGHAWAIWMGSSREKGYMDDKKRPSGAAGARLFESAAAAERAAKAAKFGGERGAAAIVRLRVECVHIESSEPGAKCAAVRARMAAREAEEIADCLAEASIDDIRRALGEPDAAEAATAQPPEEGSLAGREDGYACWVDRREGWNGGSGFVNIRGCVGPLTGAVLQGTAKGAGQKSGYGGPASIVKVACWPVAIETLIGEPEVASLSSAISWEQERAAVETLRKQSEQTLKARAKALESGAAAPRKLAGSL